MGQERADAERESLRLAQTPPTVAPKTAPNRCLSAPTSKIHRIVIAPSPKSHRSVSALGRPGPNFAAWIGRSSHRRWFGSRRPPAAPGPAWTLPSDPGGRHGTKDETYRSRGVAGWRRCGRRSRCRMSEPVGHGQVAPLRSSVDDAAAGVPVSPAAAGRGRRRMGARPGQQPAAAPGVSGLLPLLSAGEDRRGALRTAVLLRPQRSSRHVGLGRRDPGSRHQLPR